MQSVFRNFGVALVFAAALSGCKTKLEKAEDHFNTAVELYETGDFQRASIEFRNALKNDENHLEARIAFADMLLNEGYWKDAYDQYAEVIERYPDTVEVRQDMAELAITIKDWHEAERHGQQAFALAPDDARSQAIKLALDYRTAQSNRDKEAITALVDTAATLIAAHPEIEIPYQIRIDDAISRDAPDALTMIDNAIAQFPENLDFYMLKLRILSDSQSPQDIGAHLHAMQQAFPDNGEVRNALIGWYLQQNDPAGAEALLRENAGPAAEDIETHIAIVQLIARIKGIEASVTELESLVAATTGTAAADRYAAMMAAAQFEMGHQDEAIASIEKILAGAEETDATRNIKIDLAVLLESAGERTKARELVDQVLTNDPSHVAALKMRGKWLVQLDRPGEAIVALRTALGQSPRDAQIYTLLASAHERDGNQGLVGENLALAFETSYAGPAEALRYANFLIDQNRIQTAERILEDSYRANPASAQVLSALADVEIKLSKFPQALAIAQQLAESDSPAAKDYAEVIKATIVAAQDRLTDDIPALQAQLQSDDTNARAVAILIQSKLQKHDFDAARRILDEALAEKPDDKDLMLLDANLSAVFGDPDTAIRIYEDLLAANPADHMAVQMLYAAYYSIGEADRAEAALDAGLAATDNNSVLAWIKASALERAGDIDGAIAIYEMLYDRDSSSTVVANNLASLLSTYSDSPETLERAHNIARRLRSTNQPAFLDTFGWIQLKRGNTVEALTALETAAKGLPNEPTVQYHFAVALAESGLEARAKDQFQYILDTFGTLQDPMITDSRERLAAIVAKTGQ